MKKTLIVLTTIFLISIFYYFFVNQYFIIIFDSFMDFTDRTYNSRLRDEYKTKDYHYLIREIKFNKINFSRFSYATSVLLGRNERRAIDDIAKAFVDMRRDNLIRSAAAHALGKFGGKKATGILMEEVNKYRDKSYNMSNSVDVKEYRQYFYALEGLSIMQNEDIYPLLLEYARSGNKFEKMDAISLCLAHYKNHWQEVAPFYENELIKHPLSGARYFKELGHSEMAIPILRRIVETDKDPFHRRQAEEAIKYLESLKANPK